MTPPTPPEPANDPHSMLMRALNAVFPLELQSITEVYEFERVRRLYGNHGGSAGEVVEAYQEALHAIAIRQRGKAAVVPTPPHEAEIRLFWREKHWSWIDSDCGRYLWAAGVPAPDNIRDIARRILADDAKGAHLGSPGYRALSLQIHAALAEFTRQNPDGVLTSPPAPVDTRSREELLAEIARLQALVVQFQSKAIGDEHWTPQTLG